MNFYSEDALLRMSAAEFRSINVDTWVAENASGIALSLRSHIKSLSNQFDMHLSHEEFIAEIYMKIPEILSAALKKHENIDPEERLNFLMGTSVKYMKSHAYTVLRSDGIDTTSSTRNCWSLSEQDQVDEFHALLLESDNKYIQTDAQLLSDGNVDNCELTNKLHLAIEMIPNITESSRTMLRLRTVEGYTVRQVAEMMEIPAKACDAQMLRLRHRIADFIISDNKTMADFANSLRFVENRTDSSLNRQIPCQVLLTS